METYFQLAKAHPNPMIFQASECLPVDHFQFPSWYYAQSVFLDGTQAVRSNREDVDYSAMSPLIFFPILSSINSFVEFITSIYTLVSMFPTFTTCRLSLLILQNIAYKKYTLKNRDVKNQSQLLLISMRILLCRASCLLLQIEI